MEGQPLGEAPLRDLARAAAVCRDSVCRDARLCAVLGSSKRSYITANCRRHR